MFVTYETLLDVQSNEQCEDSSYYRTLQCTFYTINKVVIIDLNDLIWN